MTRFLRYILYYSCDFFYDLYRFTRYSNIEFKLVLDNTKRDYQLIMRSHVLEKSLTMPAWESGRGRRRAKELLTWIDLDSGPQRDRFAVNYACRALKTYVLKNGLEDDPEFVRFIQLYPDVTELNFKSSTLSNSGSVSYQQFASIIGNRASIRNFMPEKVDNVILQRILNDAASAPSSCNRHSYRSVLSDDKHLIASILGLQGGAAGYAENIHQLLIFVFDLRSYQGSSDRVSGYIDTSLYAMNVINLMHSAGIGSVPLNWAKNYKSDIKLRKLVAGIKPNENVVFLLGFGYPAHGFEVPESPRNVIE